MDSQREVQCRCGRRMWVQPEVRSVQCSTCHTVTPLCSIADIARGASRVIQGFQLLRRQLQQQQQQQINAQPQSPPTQSTPLPPRQQQQQPQMMAQPPPPREYHEEQKEPELTMVQPPPQGQIKGFQLLRRKLQQQQQQIKSQPQSPPQTMTQPTLLPLRQYPQQPQMMVQPPPPREYHEEQKEPELTPQRQMMMAKPSPTRLLEPLPSAFGKKRAVLCGVNYRGKSYSLKGCISDAKSMRSLLTQQMGFPTESVLMLTEDEANPERLPTKRNIRKAMRWLVEGNRARDSLVFHFSGHGSQQKDYDGDEIDGQDETICPLDHETEGKIIDDEINKILVRPLVYGAKLHAIIDACNSGTVLDLPFVCRMERNGYYHWEDQRTVKAYKGTDGGTAFCFSACDDHESSGYTPVFTGKNAGTMTYSFIKAVQTAGPAPTYGRLLNLMCYAVRVAQSHLTFDGNDTSAEPLLTSSEEFNVYTKKFIL